MTPKNKKDDPTVTTKMQDVFDLNGITYLPHYTKPVFVSPGYGFCNLTEFSEIELQSMGAKRSQYPLFSRKRGDAQTFVEN